MSHPTAFTPDNLQEKNMLATIKKLLAGGSDAATSAQLNDALESAEEDLRAKSLELDQLRKQRAVRVLDASDQELDDIEAQIVATEREIERLELAATRLEERIPEAVAREKAAELAAQEARAAELDGELEGLAKKYDKEAAKLAGLLERIAELMEERKDLPGVCIHLRVPGWMNGPHHAEIHAKRHYALNHQDLHTVQLPSLSANLPHWGDRPDWACPKPKRQPTPPLDLYAYVGMVDKAGLPIDPVGEKRARPGRMRRPL